jgi:hypothetical protein
VLVSMRRPSLPQLASESHFSSWPTGQLRSGTEAREVDEECSDVGWGHAGGTRGMANGRGAWPRSTGRRLRHGGGYRAELQASRNGAMLIGSVTRDFALFFLNEGRVLDRKRQDRPLERSRWLDPTTIPKSHTARRTSSGRVWGRLAISRAVRERDAACKPCDASEGGMARIGTQPDRG